MNADNYSETLRTAAEWFLRLRGNDIEQWDIAEWLDWCAADVQHVIAFESVQQLFDSLEAIRGTERESILALARESGSPSRHKTPRRSVAR